jgi:transposase
MRRTMSRMDMPSSRTPYDSDVADEEWAFLAPYLTVMREDAPQRKHSLRELFHGLRYIARTGLQWRYMPHDLPSSWIQQHKRMPAAT